MKNELDDASMNKNEQIIILVIGVMLAYLLFVTVMTIIDLSFQRSKHKKILKKISKESHKKLHELKS
jgi:flagellar biosynthesis protein FlhB